MVFNQLVLKKINSLRKTNQWLEKLTNQLFFGQLMSKTSMFPISDLVFQFAFFAFPNMKLALQNIQIGIPN